MDSSKLIILMLYIAKTETSQYVSVLPILSSYPATSAHCYLFCLSTTQPILSVTYSVSLPHN